MKIKLILLAIALFLLSMPSQAQLLVEDFNYTAGTAITANNWTAHSVGGTNPITVTNGGLTYPSYASSNVGNAASMTTSGEDDNRTFATQTAGVVYAAFLVNLSAASTNAAGDYFFHLADNAVTGASFRGRVYARRDAGGAVSFGISKSGTTPQYTAFNYALNTTYLMVVRYAIVPGATNDVVDLYINPVLGQEGIPTISATDTATADPTNIGAVALRQGGAATSPTATVDGIRVGTTFADAAALAPTSAFVSISGKINASLLSGNILVTITDMQGVARSMVASKTGTFRFRNVSAGETYVLTVQARGYSFTPKVITVTEDVTEVNFEPVE